MKGTDMPEPDEEAQDNAPEASVDDLAAAVARQLALYQEEDALLSAEFDKIKARRAVLKVEITKAERITRSLLPRSERGKKPAEVNPPVQQEQVQTEPVEQGKPAPAFKPE